MSKKAEKMVKGLCEALGVKCSDFGSAGYVFSDKVYSFDSGALPELRRIIKEDVKRLGDHDDKISAKLDLLIDYLGLEVQSGDRIVKKVTKKGKK